MINIRRKETLTKGYPVLLDSAYRPIPPRSPPPADDAARTVVRSTVERVVDTPPTPRMLALAPTIGPEPVVGRTPAVTVARPAAPRLRHTRSLQVLVAATVGFAALVTGPGTTIAAEEGAAESPPLRSFMLAPTSAPDPTVGTAPRVTVARGPRPRDTHKRSVQVVREVVATGAGVLPMTFALAPTRAPDPAVGIAPAVTVARPATPRLRHKKSVQVAVTTWPEVAITDADVEEPETPACRHRASVQVVVTTAPDAMVTGEDTGVTVPPLPSPRMLAPSPRRAPDPMVGIAPAVTVANPGTPRLRHKTSVQVAVIT